MTVFSILWQPSKSEKKYPIGILVYQKKWHFKYNLGIITEAIAQGFRPFPDMPNIEEEYISEILFPVFRNRYLEKDNIDAMKEQTGQLTTDKILIKYMK